MREVNRTVDFGILGSFEVRADGRAITISSARQAALLAILLLHRNRVVSAEQVVDALWNGAAPRSARDALHVHVSQLRRVLGPVAATLLTRPPGYVLTVAGESVDAARFERSIERAQAAMAQQDARLAATELQQGLALWRGPALADFADYAFAEAEIGRLEELRLNAVEDLMRAELALGRHAEVVGGLEAHVAAHPLRERPRRQLMLALYRAGRQAEALEVYRDTRATLVRELGIEPGRPLRALQEGILRQSPALDYRRPRRRRREHTTPLLGRDEDVRQVSAKLRSEAVRLVTLTGTGGVGKTRLAMELCASASFDAGVVFVDLAAVTDANLVGPSIVKALAVKERSGRSQIQSIVDDAAGKRLLLVLDNFEQVLSARSFVAELLEALPRLTVLVTSRRALGLRAEHVHEVPPLALGVARALFGERGRAVVPDFEVTPHNAEAVTEICRRLDRLPLALELAAARLRLLSPEAIVARLGQPLAVLTKGSPNAPARHGTLRGTIEWSHDLLSPTEQALFARLSVFAGGWLPDDVEAVTAGSGGDFLNDLDSLIAGSLVYEAGRTNDQPRFAMLQTIREHAREKLVARGEVDEFERRHAQYFAELAEQGEPALTGGPEQAQWVARLDAEYDNLRAALRWCRRSGDAMLQLRLAGSLRRLWLLTGRAVEGRMWLEEALEKTMDVRTELRAKTLLGASSVARMQGDYHAAEAHGAAAHALYAQLGDAASAARALCNLAGIAACVGNGERARELYEQGIELLREVEDVWGLAVSLTNLADLMLSSGAAERAGALFEESLALYREAEDEHGVGVAVASLGVAKLRAGDVEAALPLLEQALSRATTLGDKEGAARCLEDLGAALVALRDDEGATRALGSAAAIREQIGSSRTPSEETMYQETLAAVRGSLDAESFDHCWEDGRNLDADDVLRLAAGAVRA